MDALRYETTATIEAVKADLVKWLFGGMIAQGGLIVALVKLLQKYLPYLPTRHPVHDSAPWSDTDAQVRRLPGYSSPGASMSLHGAESRSSMPFCGSPVRA